MPAGQPIRRSQFITTYGPGAILEGPDGPRIIPTIDGSQVFRGLRVEDFEITEPRLSQALLNQARILRLPSNAELGIPEGEAVYQTSAFPTWALCTRHQILYHKRAQDSRACPLCPQHPDRFKAWQQVHREAIRFVMACSQGHLDDVPWSQITHSPGSTCQPTYLRWEGGGGALRQVEISCPVSGCGARLNLGQAYSRRWPCHGRSPETGIARPGCADQAEIIQRGAANLHMPALQTALTIPPRSTRLHRLLEQAVVSGIIQAARPATKQELLDLLQRLIQTGLLRVASFNEISAHTDEEVSSAIVDTLHGGNPGTVAELRNQEFAALCHSARFGAPPRQSSAPGSPPQFEVVARDVRTIPGPRGTLLRITPVNRLRVVMVQTGYRRLDPANPPVDRIYDDGQLRWYPGVELFGEGVFIDLNPVADETCSRPHFDFLGAEASAWFDAWVDPVGWESSRPPEDPNQLHPIFIWWHTLSHRLINALAIDSGYSSASIRERVFVNIDENGGGTGGVLLYTAQPGGDGTLGGLVALARDFTRVLEVAIANLDACSNDPLCGDEAFGKGKYNGAACYACCLISETSCEHRNMWLDRRLLLRNW